MLVHLLITYYVPGILLGTLHIQYFSLKLFQKHFIVHFIDNKL